MLDPATVHDLMCHVHNLRRRLENITNHARELALQNSRLRSVIRSSAAVSKTALFEMDHGKDEVSPDQTVARALQQSHLRKEELHRAISECSAPLPGESQEVSYYADIFDENKRLRRALKEVKREVGRMKKGVAGEASESSETRSATKGYTCYEACVVAYS